MRQLRGGRVALYVREYFDCIEIDDDEDGKVACLWVKIKGKVSRAGIMVGVCYRPPNQDKQADEAFYKQLTEISLSPALVLVGSFNLPNVCWKCKTSERKQSRRFLEYVEENFLI
ncbi:hypothetical protein TURU_008643 [Turdus rufiventris]|nr:hypothetical protein TURU_008643 [Turdus rufiventris]